MNDEGKLPCLSDETSFRFSQECCCKEMRLVNAFDCKTEIDQPSTNSFQAPKTDHQLFVFFRITKKFLNSDFVIYSCGVKYYHLLEVGNNNFPQNFWVPTT